MSGRYFLIMPLFTPSSLSNSFDCWRYSKCSFVSSRSFRICFRLLLYSDSLVVSADLFSSLSVMSCISFSKSFLSLFAFDIRTFNLDVSVCIVRISFCIDKNFCSLTSSSLIAVSISSRLSLYFDKTDSNSFTFVARNSLSICCVHVGHTKWN